MPSKCPGKWAPGAERWGGTVGSGPHLRAKLPKPDVLLAKTEQTRYTISILNI